MRTTGLILFSLGIHVIGSGYSPLWAQDPAGLALDGHLAKTIVAHGHYIWTATQAGVFRSSDSGKTWSSAPVPNPGLGVDHLFSVADKLFLKQGWWLSNSDDDGENWVAGPLLPPDFNRMAADGNTLVAGVSEKFDPLLSVDEGLNWSLPLAYFPDSSRLRSVFQDDSLIWIVTENGLYYSIDGSASWTRLEIPAPRYVDRKSGMLWVGSDSGLFIVSPTYGSFRSEKVPYNGSLGSVSGPNQFAEAGGWLFAIRNDPGRWIGSLYCSRDSGKSWSPTRNQGLPALPDSGPEAPYFRINSIVGLGGVLVAVVNDSYLFHSDDRGETWAAGTGGSFGGHVPGSVTRVTVFRDSIAALVLQVQDYWIVSGDSGRSWQRQAGPPDLGLPDHGPWSSPLAPGLENLFASGNQVFAICKSHQGFPAPNGYWHSPDKGVTWDSTRGTAYRERLRLHADLGSVRFESDPRGLMSSVDGGASWSRSLETTAEPSRLLVAGSTLFALAGSSLFAGYDSGSQWKQILFRGDPSVYDIAGFAGRVFAATNEGLYVSIDGLAWVPSGNKATSLRQPAVPAGKESPHLVLPRSGRGYDFHFRLDKAARISIGLFSASGNRLGSVSETRGPGDQEIRIPATRSMAVFYRMEIEPLGTAGHRRVMRGPVGLPGDRR